MTTPTHTGQAHRPSRHTPQRTCIACRRTADQSALIRLLSSDQGEVVVDHPHKLGGRGVYVCGSAKCLARALRSQKLGPRGKAPALEQVRAQISGRIERRVDGLLASARTTGTAAVGLAEVEAELRGQDKPELVIVARDASPRGRADLEAVARQAGVTVLEYGDKARLGLPFARDSVAAVALARGGLASAVRTELELLQGLVPAAGRRDDTESSQRERV